MSGKTQQRRIRRKRRIPVAPVTEIGNLTERQTDTGKLVYTYNSDNRLRRFERWNEGESQPVIVATYEYDREGRRTQKTVTENGTEKTVNFTWDGDKLIAEHDGNGQLIKAYRYGLGYAPTQMITPNGAYTVHTDHLDTPYQLTDEQGTIVWQANHAAYGKTNVNEDPDGDGQAITFNIRFPGQYEDEESGLYYNRHRYYDATTGRYIRKDPIGLRGGINVYAYANGNPITGYDPSGLYNPERAGPKPKPSMFNPPRPSSTYTSQFLQGAQDMASNYSDMRFANWRNSDKYFHCKANCQATRRGPGGKQAACLVSDGREWWDENFKGYGDGAADQSANRHGRDGAISSPDSSCEIICDRFRPKGLPGDY
jgi:RHS repeat-associated protein